MRVILDSLTRTVAPLVIVVTMLVSMVAVGTYAFKKNRDDVLALSNDLVEALARRIESEVAHFLDPISELLYLISSFSNPTEFEPHPEKIAERVAIAAFARLPQISAFLMADASGNLVMVERQPDGAIYTQHVQRSKDGATKRWLFRDLDGRITRYSEPQATDLDPRRMRWYEGAQTAKGLYWTDVYAFFSSRKAGLTASFPVLDDEMSVHGVLGVDVELSRLGAFLSALKISDNGYAVLVNRNGALVAHPDLDRMLTGSGDQLRVSRIAEIDDPVLNRAFNRYLIEKDGFRTFEVNGTAYVSASLSMAEALGRDWAILVVAPEDDFAGFVGRNLGTVSILAVVVLALGSALAILLVVQSRRADRNARLVEIGQAELDSQSEAFAELAHLLALHETDDKQATREFTRLIADATDATRASIWRVESVDVLRCLDCCDRRSGGHTRGTELHRSEIATLLDSLSAGETIAVGDALQDPRTEPLRRLYLGPLDCAGLLATPVRIEGRLTGTVWLEEQDPTRVWTRREISFVRSVANMISARLRGTDIRMGGPPVTRNAAEIGALEGNRKTRATLPAPHKAMRSPELSINRSNRFLEKLAGRHLHRGALAADVFSDTSVVFIGLPDGIQLAQKSEDDQSTNTADALVRHIEVLANELDVPYLKIVGDVIVGAAGFAGDSQSGSRAVARMALGVRDYCDMLLTRLNIRLEYQIGIDTGVAIGCRLGHDGTSYNLWGEAVATSRAMAESSMTGCIQVSESSYQMLRNDFLFRSRGRFFAEGLGVTATYIMTGEL